MKEYKGDADSIQNMNIKDRFVKKNIIMRCNDIVDAVGIEDIVEHRRNDYEPKVAHGGECENCGQEVESIDTRSGLCEDCYYSKDIYEYWFVTEYLAEKISENGGVIYDRFDNPIWGRETTGQNIALDSIISDICVNLEVLEGQRYEWK